MDQLPNLPKLGFGLMRLPLTEESKIDMPQLFSMVDAYLGQGFRYFDTAYVYHDGTSETALKAALTDRYPRDAFYVADKLPAWAMESPADVQRIFEEQLARTGLEYFDFYLLHAVQAENVQKYEDFGCWQWAQEMKAQGRIRHFGFSFHATPQVLDEVLTKHPEAEFVQLQLNYADWEDAGVQAGECWRVARKHGKAVVVMEPVKGGSLAALRPEMEAQFKALRPQSSIASWALRFAASQEGVMMVLSGMSDETQMQDNLATMAAFEPLNEAEQACVARVQQALKATPRIGCTGCRYCAAGCPQNIDIAGVLRAYSQTLLYGENDRNKAAYEALLQKNAPAQSCIGCGQCETVCPQHLPVIQRMNEASALFD